MKEDKKDDDDNDENDVNAEETEAPEKKARLDETEEDKPVAEQNGVVEPESEPMDEDNIQEIQSNEESKEINSEDSVVPDPIATDTVVETKEIVAEPESEPLKESPAPALKTTPTRGRGGGRGRGVARRGRSSR